MKNLVSSFSLVYLAVFCSVIISSKGEDLITKTEKFANNVATAVAAAYKDRCTANCSSCVSFACSSRRRSSVNTCTRLYGNTEVVTNGCTYQCNIRKVDHTFSNVLTPSAEVMEQISDELCWAGVVDEAFKENFRADLNDSLRWQYFASSKGWVKLYPSHTLQTCHVLNPLIRPWYVAATSGPKNVIIILDISASTLNNNRLGIAKEAAMVVIQTLTNADYATVVVFSDTGRQLLVANQKDKFLIQATYANIELLSSAVSNIQGDSEGATNFEAAFVTAFDILDASRSNASNCHTAILFLTDGFPNKGQTSQDDIVNLIRERNSYHNATMFTYTLGSNSGASYTRAIACETGGIYTEILHTEDLRKQLSLYYDYFASLRHSSSAEVAWVEPYEDAVGAGFLVTASKAVYANSTTGTGIPQLIGVVGVDVSLTGLQESLTSYESVIRMLSERNSCPRIQSYSQEVLDRIRARQGGVPCGVCEGCGNDERTCSINKVAYCSYNYRQYENNSDLYREDSCCFNADNSSDIKLCDRGFKPSYYHVFLFVFFAFI